LLRTLLLPVSLLLLLVHDDRGTSAVVAIPSAVGTYLVSLLLHAFMLLLASWLYLAAAAAAGNPAASVEFF
jgi:hypothetical protein